MSEFERYRGFFPSYVDDQLDFSTDTTVGDVHADADVANDGQGSINSLFRPKETAQPKKKFTILLQALLWMACCKAIMVHFSLMGKPGQVTCVIRCRLCVIVFQGKRTP